MTLWQKANVLGKKFGWAFRMGVNDCPPFKNRADSRLR